MKFRLLLALFLSLSSGAAAQEHFDLKIGVLLPLTGEWAAYGTLVQRGLLIAAKENARLRLFFEDCGTMSGAAAASAAQSLISTKKVELLVVLDIDSAEAVAPIAQAHKTPLVIMWDNSRRVEALGRYVFSNGYSTEAGGSDAAVLLAGVEKKGRVAILKEPSAYITAAVSNFRERTEALGGSVVFETELTPGAGDVRSVVTRLKKAAPEAIYLQVTLPSTVIAVFKAMEQQRMALPVVTNEIFVGQVAADLGKLADGVYASWVPMNNAVVEEKYRSDFGEGPWNMGPVLVGYDAAACLARVKDRPESTLLERLEEYFGARHRFIDRRMVFVRYLDGRYETVKLD